VSGGVKKNRLLILSDGEYADLAGPGGSDCGRSSQYLIVLGIAADQLAEHLDRATRTADMPETPQEIAERLRAVTDKFKAELPERIGALKAALEALPGSLDEARHAAHKLAGGCGTFGLHELGAIARRIETTLDAAIGEKRTPSETEQGLAFADLALLQQASDRGIEIPAAAAVSDRSGTAPLVYVVDDDATAMALMRAQLKAKGFQAEGFDTLDGARQACRRTAPAVVVLDVLFPDEDLDGIEAAQSLQDAAGKPLPIILVSGKQDMATRLRAASSVATAYMTKPVDVEALDRRIRQLLKQTAAESYRVALVDDDTSVTSYYQALLSSQGYAVTTVNDPMLALAELQAARPHLIVLDLRMPGCSGTDLAKVIRQDSSLDSVPIIFLSGETNPRLQEDAISVGGQEFLTKPVTDTVLLETVRQHIARGREVSKRIAAISRIDPATGLVARKYFLHHLATLLEQKDQPTKITLIYLVVPQLYAVLQSAGYAHLDDLNALAGHAIENAYGRTAVVSNLAPGAFACLVDDPDFAQVVARSKQLPDLVVSHNKMKVPLKPRVGVVPLSSVTGTPDSVFTMIHEQLAKSHSPFWTHQASKTAPIGDTIELIRDGVSQKNLRVFFRPIVCMDEGFLKLIEVFPKLDLRNGKLVPYDAYAPIAEEMQVSVELDRKVTSAVISELDKRRAASMEIEVFVPVSDESVVSGGYLRWLESSLIFAPMDKKHTLVLTVGRSALHKSLATGGQFFDQARKAGHKVAMAGFGPQSVLRPLFGTFRFDYVLLDEALIGDFERKKINHATLLAAVEEAKFAASRVIACGVREPKTVSMLWRMGVRDFQGYMVENAKPTIDLADLVSQISM
jgi:DNA-binding response OmpR family regulator/EAL domain-containing protein (putative c-di-GMP-specific phosphodiesterase class I)/HPt (histidine-containing phosphotransfer) domain-containing protein